ncbi:MAG: hypothetical protein ACRD7E_00085, partial [Bryobacteraceae bacterium]
KFLNLDVPFASLVGITTSSPAKAIRRPELGTWTSAPRRTSRFSQSRTVVSGFWTRRARD